MSEQENVQAKTENTDATQMLPAPPKRETILLAFSLSGGVVLCVLCYRKLSQLFGCKPIIYFTLIADNRSSFGSCRSPVECFANIGFYQIQKEAKNAERICSCYYFYRKRSTYFFCNNCCCAFANVNAF